MSGNRVDARVRVRPVAAAALGCLLLLGGCGGEKQEEARDDSPRPRGSQEQRPRGYLETVVGAKTYARNKMDPVNMRGLLTALITHASMNDGKFPPSLDALAESDSSAGAIVEAARKRSPYGYVSGHKQTDPPATVILYETLADGDGKRYVGRIGAAVELLDEEQFLQAVPSAAPSGAP